MAPFLQVKNISKEFAGVKALTDISIDFNKGEVHALLGENGAGKSTLIKIISGVYAPTSGSVLLDGKACRFHNPRQALDRGIVVIHQELSIANDLTVAENIYLGCEPRIQNGFFLDRKKMEADAQAILDFMEVDILSTAVARHLTAAQQQMVEIAKVISKNAQVVIMDEPTSSLSEHEINALFKQIRILQKNNIAIIYITHRLKELFEIADRVTVLRDGCKVNTFSMKDVDEKTLVTSMVGREMKDYYNRQKHTPGKELLRIEHLSRDGEFSDSRRTDARHRRKREVGILRLDERIRCAGRRDHHGFFRAAGDHRHQRQNLGDVRGACERRTRLYGSDGRKDHGFCERKRRYANRIKNRTDVSAAIQSF
ncbi:sugar ABC transporter ATP-binding protein [Treponema socranskii]|uniref:sugar ABC transporter ATP-binding protein n=1 Tax=Treponema socranskii TaxID=53419 RepID=UPI0028715882|nr:sugar ABC transporter ATP-binding protein [Treponema socranskii]MDR9859469.1 sugar ABC transporter ATP-binding protein [Treponema socranskii]